MHRVEDKIFDLLKNEDFVLWVVSPREESTHYWTKWMAANPDRIRDVEMARYIIRSSQKRVSDRMPAEAYDYVLEKIVSHARDRKINPGAGLRKLWRPVGIAASVSLVLFALFRSAWMNAPEKTISACAVVEKDAPFGMKLTTVLPDGSVVTINSGTRISFPDAFVGDTREVSLSGEAFFDVEHDPEKPFYVKMNGHKVRVLGTSFNVRSYPEDSVVYVSVASGRVSYTVPSGKEVVLMPDQMATYLPSEDRLSKGPVNRLQAFGWRDRIIYFDSTAFNDVIRELERWYGVEIETNGHFDEIGTFSGEFRNETLFQVLKGLSFVYPFEFEIKGKSVTLTKKVKPQTKDVMKKNE